MRFSKYIIALFLLSALKINADEFSIMVDSANVAYSKNNFEKAIKGYQTVLDKGVESYEIYFNLGNAYFKSNNLGLAILNYERAKKLNPDDEDLINNLKLANQKTEDKIDAMPELFLKQWKNGMVDLFSEREWSLICITLIILGLLLFSVYIISSKSILKQLGFFGGGLFIILSVAVFFIAKHKYNLTITTSSAIITTESVTVSGSPTEKGTKLFVLHEGTKVEITDEGTDWTEVKIANGNVGWIKTSQLEKI